VNGWASRSQWRVFINHSRDWNLTARPREFRARPHTLITEVNAHAHELDDRDADCATHRIREIEAVSRRSQTHQRRAVGYGRKMNSDVLEKRAVDRSLGARIKPWSCCAADLKPKSSPTVAEPRKGMSVGNTLRADGEGVAGSAAEQDDLGV